MVSTLFEKLSQIDYLQHYDFIEYMNANNEKAFKMLPKDKTLKKANNILKLIPDDITGQRILDIGCNKGFFSFECIRRNAAYVLGIDISKQTIDILKEIADSSPLFKGLEFKQTSLTKDLLQEKSFDTILCLSCYHYLYSETKSHKEIFSILAKLCGRQVILELPLEMDDNFARSHLEKDLQGELLKAYNVHAILHAASLYFGSVRYIANSGFLRTRDIFLLEEPNRKNPFSWEWQGKTDIWSEVR